MKKFKISKQDIIDVVKKRWWIMLIEVALLAFILVADQLSKARAVRLYNEKGSFEVIPGLITLGFVKNTGAGFGSFQGGTVALSVITIIIMAAIVVYLIIAQKQTMWLRIPLIFIVGGGIGNVIDRLSLGYVRDFVQFSFWEEFPLFNVADNFVTIGAFMLVIVLIVMLVDEGKKNQKEFEKEQAEKLAKGETEQGVDPLDAPINLNPMLPSDNEFDFVNTIDKNAADSASGKENSSPDGGEGNTSND